MASAYNRDQPNIGFVPPIDTDFFVKSLQGLQGKYDENVGKLQSQVANLKSIQLANPNAQKYLESRYNERISNVEKYMGNPAFASELNKGMGELVSAVDTNVMVEYAGTMAGKQIDTQAEEIQKKHPNLYSQDNLEWSKKEYNKWASDPNREVGAYYQGNRHYVPYTDMSKIAEKVKKILPPDVSLEIKPDGSGYRYMKNGEEWMMENSIEKAVASIVDSDPNYRTQMKINAWSKFKGVSDEKVANYYAKDFLTDKITHYRTLEKENHAIENGKILASFIEKGVAPKKAEALEEKSMYYGKAAKKYEERLQEIKDNKYDIKSLRDMAEEDIERNNLMSNLASVMAYDKITSRDIVTDQVALTQWKDNQDNNRALQKRLWDVEDREAKEKNDLKQSILEGKIDPARAAKMGIMTAEEINSLTLDPNSIKYLPGETKKSMSADDLYSKSEEGIKALEGNYAKLADKITFLTGVKTNTRMEADGDLRRGLYYSILVKNKYGKYSVDTDGDGKLEEVKINDASRDDLISTINEMDGIIRDKRRHKSVMDELKSSGMARQGFLKGTATFLKDNTIGRLPNAEDATNLLVNTTIGFVKNPTLAGLAVGLAKANAEGAIFKDTPSDRRKNDALSVYRKYGLNVEEDFTPIGINSTELLIEGIKQGYAGEEMKKYQDLDREAIRDLINKKVGDEKNNYTPAINGIEPVFDQNKKLTFKKGDEVLGSVDVAQLAPGNSLKSLSESIYRDYDTKSRWANLGGRVVNGINGNAKIPHAEWLEQGSSKAQKNKTTYCAALAKDKALVFKRTSPSSSIIRMGIMQNGEFIPERDAQNSLIEFDENTITDSETLAKIGSYVEEFKIENGVR